MELECKIRQFRDEVGMKQKFLAEKVGISQTALGLIERGKSLPTLPVAFKISDVIGKPIEEIWVRKGE